MPEGGWTLLLVTILGGSPSFFVPCGGLMQLVSGEFESLVSCSRYLGLGVLVCAGSVAVFCGVGISAFWASHCSRFARCRIVSGAHPCWWARVAGVMPASHCIRMVRHVAGDRLVRMGVVAVSVAVSRLCAAARAGGRLCVGSCIGCSVCMEVMLGGFVARVECTCCGGLRCC